MRSSRERNLRLHRGESDKDFILRALTISGANILALYGTNSGEWKDFQALLVKAANRLDVAERTIALRDVHSYQRGRQAAE